MNPNLGVKKSKSHFNAYPKIKRNKLTKKRPKVSLTMEEAANYPQIVSRFYICPVCGYLHATTHWFT